MANVKFPERIILGIGYPWAYGVGPYFEIGLNSFNTGVLPKKLKWPKELWHKDLPKYRLVLEKIK